MEYHEERLVNVINRHDFHEITQTRSSYMAEKSDHKFDILQDIEYKEWTSECCTQDGVISKNKLDLFLPKDSDPSETPVVIFVHGGGWMRGDRRAYKHYFSCYDTNLLVALVLAYYDAYWNVGRTFARGGIACAVISYRLSRLEFPWLLLELCTSLIMSVTVVLTPLVCVALLCYCISSVHGFAPLHFLQGFIGVLSSSSAVGAGNGNHYSLINPALVLWPSALTICAMFALASLFIIWLIVCQTGEGYFITPQEKLFPLLSSLLFSCLCLLMLDIELGSIALCLTVCMGLCLLHSFATFQQTCRPIVKHPKHITDVALSVAWVRRYGGESKRFNHDKLFLCGHSAGGHLISLLALDPKYLNNVGLSQVNIKGVISISGVYNLHKLSGSILEYLFLRPAFGTNPDTWTSASPYHKLMMLSMTDRKTAEESSSCSNNDHLQVLIGTDEGESPEHFRVPFLVINAEKDLHLLEDAERFVVKLKEQDFYCKHSVIKDTNHMSIIMTFGSAQCGALSARCEKKESSIHSLCSEFIKELESL